MSGAAPAAPAAPTSASEAAPGSPDKKRARWTPEPAGDEPTPTTAASAAATPTMAATLLQPPTTTATAYDQDAADTHIHLTPHEQQLFELLRGAAAAAGKGTVLRVAGGWVRDKLLGRCVVVGVCGAGWMCIPMG